MAKLGGEATYRRAATSEWTTEMLQRRRELIIAIAATLALTATMASPAHASDSDVDDAESVSATIEAATPTTILSEPGVVKGGQLSTTVGEISAAVPLSAEENVVVSVPIDGGIQTASRAIELPDEIPISDGVVAEDGTVVFTADDRSGDAVAVQTLADGSTRIQTVLGGAENGPIWGMKLTRAETSRVRDYTAAVGMCGFFAKALPRVFQACAVFGSYIVAQAHIAQGDNPKTCLFFTAAPVPGVIMRVTC